MTQKNEGLSLFLSFNQANYIKRTMVVGNAKVVSPITRSIYNNKKKNDIQCHGPISIISTRQEGPLTPETK